MPSLDSLMIKIFADGANVAGILDLYAKPYIQGLTTNPTLMRKAGIGNYEAFAREVLRTVASKPISFEVLSDDFAEMRRQALKIAGWGTNVFVKIPITNSSGDSSVPLIGELAKDGVRLNVTAILTSEQVRRVAEVLHANVPAVVSVFAGRIADTGRDPVPIMRECRGLLSELPKADLLWASVREVLNIVQAAEVPCDIVTVTHDILAKAAKLLDMDLNELSRETVQMFTRDAAHAGFTI